MNGSGLSALGLVRGRRRVLSRVFTLLLYRLFENDPNNNVLFGVIFKTPVTNNVKTRDGTRRRRPRTEPKALNPLPFTCPGTSITTVPKPHSDKVHYKQMCR